MILPVVSYGSLLHLNPTRCQRTKLTSFHNRAVKIADNSNQHSNEMPSPFGISVTKSCALVRRCLDVNVCSNFINYFEMLQHSKSTRNCGYLLRLPKIRLEYCRGSFYYMGAKLYNELPITIRKTESYDEFKEQLKAYAIANF